MNGFRRLLPRGYRLADWLMACAAPLCLLWLLEGFSRGDAGSVPIWAVSQPGLFAINYALYAAPCLLLCLVPSRRARLCSLLALGLLCAVLGIANRYKIFYRMEPLLFSDVAQLGDAWQAAAGLALDIFRRCAPSLWQTDGSATTWWTSPEPMARCFPPLPWRTTAGR